MNPKNLPKLSAILVVDMQNGVLASAFLKDKVIDNVKLIVEKARSHGVPVIWIQHSSDELVENTENWKIVSELKPEENELFIFKKFGDSFEDTVLGEKLNQLGVEKVFVVGAQTDACIRATLHGAFVRGYETTLVSDAHTTEDLTAFGLPSPEQLISFTNIYWTWQKAPGRAGAVVKAAELDFDVK